MARGDVGIGASVALNILDTNVTRAEVEDTAVLTGGGSVSLSATAGHTVGTTAEAGSAGGSVAISPSVAISIADNETTASIGTGGVLDASGTVDVSATHSSSVTTLSDGSAAGGVGVGNLLGIRRVSKKRSVIAFH